ncbi:VOC family protein [Neobacillus muris]|uniref:VOC family protein n=1 Tax=Neobacillus muris TaxID=2941334 RepID=UPI00203E9480|nr:VOC family protein [Neobacillus muris]
MSDFIFHIATVEIPVTNLRKSIAFYTDILGVEVKHEEESKSIEPKDTINAPEANKI